jgi:hypothetical protein
MLQWAGEGLPDAPNEPHRRVPSLRETLHTLCGRRGEGHVDL